MVGAPVQRNMDEALGIANHYVVDIAGDGPEH